MKKPKNHIGSIFVSILLLSLVSGCAAYRAGNLPQISSWPPESVNDKKSISIVVSGEAILGGKHQAAPSTYIKISQEPTAKAYRNAGLFSDVKVGFAETDLRAEVKIVHQGETNLGLGFLSGLTLFLIPSKTTDEFVVKTTIKDSEGDTIGTFEKSETITMWQQLFLIFATPFNFPGSVVKETLYDLNRAIINEAHSQGVI